MRWLNILLRRIVVGAFVAFALCTPALAQYPAFEPQAFQQAAAANAPPAAMPLTAANGEPRQTTGVAEPAQAQATASPPANSAGGSVWADIQSQAGEVFRTLGRVWGVVILTGTDGKPLVTVGTLFSGIVLLCMGHLAAKWISRWVGSKVLRRVGLEADAAAPVQSITFYALLVMFTMLTLNILNVPITVFSFLGGALAIGAGFGSQNIVNNFISGLILLAERPVRVGDVIEVDGRTGKVVEIGARSTRLSTGNNFEVIVPNSKLLEGTLVNWTLSDDRIGATIKIGVAYGAKTREVGKVLEAIALEHANILKTPAPEASFVDFGDNALMFELKFWLHLRRAGKGSIESDLRYRIDEVFTERGIVIAYPQRDVHLNVIRPVEVRLTESSVSARRSAA